MYERSGNVAVFWDYENCPAPASSSGWEIAREIRQLAQTYGSIKVFRAYLELPEQPGSPESRSFQLRSDLQASGVSLTDCPHNGRKDVADKMILVDMMAHAIDNPAPWTYLLITGDRDFAYAISVLGLRRYDVVLVSPRTAHISLRSQAAVCLDWGLVLEKLTLGSSRKSGQSQEPQSASRPASHGASIEKSLLIKSPSRGRNMSFSDHDDGNSNNGDLDPISRLRAYQQRRRASSLSSNDSQSVALESSSSTAHTAYLSTREAPVSSPPPVSTAKPTHGVDSGSSTPAVLIGRQAASTIPGDSLQTRTPQLAFGTTNGLSAAASAFRPSSKDNSSLPSLSANHAAPPARSSSPAPSQPTVTNSPNLKLVIPAIFRPLVVLLREYQTMGFWRPSRTDIGRVLDQYAYIYSQAKVERFGQYIALAEKHKIVTQSAEWIALRPEWSES